jgi:hypothetical protein
MYTKKAHIMLIKSACNVRKIYKEYHMKSLQNVHISSVKEQGKQTRMTKPEYKNHNKMSVKRVQNHTTKCL